MQAAGVRPSPPVATSRSRSLRRAWRLRGVYLFLVPSLVLLAIFDYWPFILALWRSLYDWNGMTIANYIAQARSPSRRWGFLIHRSQARAASSPRYLGIPMTSRIFTSSSLRA